MNKNIMRKTFKSVTALVMSICLLCGIITPSAFAATLSPSRDGIVEIYQLAPESGSLLESYVIKTPNGKLVVIDGGIDGGGEEVGITATPYITAALRSIAGVGEGEHFTVDAWFVSHGHCDHYLELGKILCAYTDDASYTGETVTLADNTTQTWKATPDTNFTIKNFYLDFPEESEWSKATEFTQSPYFAKFKEGLDKYAKVNNITVTGDSYYDDINGKVVNQEAIDKGLTITIDGVDFEILQTWSTGDGQVNDNSMVIRVVNEGKSALFLNDATVASGDRLLASYDVEAVRSDIVQLGHHGQNGCSQAFYEKIDAQNSVRLWAASAYVWRGEASNLQTKEVRSWFGLAESAEDYVATRMDLVAALYDAFPVDKTSVTAWNAVIDQMKVTLPTEPVYRTAQQFDLVEGATIRVGTPDKINGLRFSAIMATVDTEAEYGFVIVPRKYMETITSASGFDGDYIDALIDEYGTDGIIKMGSMPIDKGNHFQINGSVGNIKFKNSTIEFTPIAYKYKDGAYTYAAYDTIDDISMSIFKLATKAYTDNPNGTYASVYKEFVDNAINLINGNPQGTEITSYNLNFDQTAVTLYPEDVKDLAFDTDFDMENITLKYDAGVVSYDVETGKVEFVRCGTTTITASCMGQTASVDVTCTVPVEDGYLAQFDHDAYLDLIGKNDYPARSAADVQVERVASYEDKNGVTETNVVKITTTAASGFPYVADFAIDLPKPVNVDGSKKVTVRMLVAQSDAEAIGFRNMNTLKGDYQQAYCGSPELIVQGGAYNASYQQNEWFNITLNYTTTKVEDMSNLSMLVQGGEAGKTHTFYLAYVMETDAVADILADTLPEGYVADFDSTLYSLLVEDGKTTNTVKTKWLESYQGEKGVLKVEVTGGGHANDFLLNLPKSHSGQYTLRMYVGSGTDVAQIGTYTSAGGWCDAFFATPYAYEKNKWHSITINDSNAGFEGTKIGIQGYDSTYDTLEVYLAWIIDGSDNQYVAAAEEAWRTNMEQELVAQLPEGYVADFSSSFYSSLIEDGYQSNTVKTTWLESYKGEKGVLKVEVTGTTSRKDFVLTLPKSHSGKYTLRMYVGSSTNVAQIGTCTSAGGWCDAFFADGYVKDQWYSIKIDDSNSGFNNSKIGIMAWDGSNHTLEVYLAWVIDGQDNQYVADAEETWNTNIEQDLGSSLPVGTLADFSSANYTSLISGSQNANRTPKSVQSTYLDSYTDKGDTTKSGVLKVEVTTNYVAENNCTGDFLVELPKSITKDTIKVRYAVVYEDGEKGATDWLLFSDPSVGAGRGMYTTDNQIAHLIGDGCWHEMELKWSSEIKDQFYFQLSTATNNEKVTIYFDEVTE